MLLKIVCWTILVWTGLFALLVVPFTSLYEWNVIKRPIVTALVSNTRSEWVQAKSGGNYEVFGALDYDRPSQDGLSRCHIDRYLLGTLGSADAQAWTVQLAVHPDTCEGPVRLPLRTPSGLRGWSLVYIAGCAFSAILGFCINSLVPRSKKGIDLSSAPASPTDQNIGRDSLLRLPSWKIYTDAERQHDDAPFFVFGILSIPIIFGLAVLPFWDRIGDWPVVASIDRALAPAIGSLPDVHQLAATPRRFLIAGSLMMYVIFLSQIILLLFSRRRRFLLLETYDLRKVHFYRVFFCTWFIVGLMWYVMFVHGSAIKSSIFLSLTRLLRRFFYIFPFLVLLVGQMTTIAVLGASRDIIHFARRFRAQRMPSH